MVVWISFCRADSDPGQPWVCTTTLHRYVGVGHVCFSCPWTLKTLWLPYQSPVPGACGHKYLWFGGFVCCLVSKRLPPPHGWPGPEPYVYTHYVCLAQILAIQMQGVPLRAAYRRRSGTQTEITFSHAGLLALLCREQHAISQITRCSQQGTGNGGRRSKPAQKEQRGKRRGRRQYISIYRCYESALQNGAPITT